MTCTTFSLPRNWLLTIMVAVLFATTAWANGPERVIHTFQSGSDGAWPSGGLIADESGNLYGTTEFGGGSFSCGTFRRKPVGCGTVFELTRTDGGRDWIATVLYAFQLVDGAKPQGGLVFDAVGNLYGTTSAGGTLGIGTVFQLAPPANHGGAWTLTTIYSFSTFDGSFPAGLIVDQQGNLYGELPESRGYYGSVFELSPPAKQGGSWTYNVLYEFKGGSQRDGNGPVGGLVMGKSGNLYGTTWLGGLGSGCNADGCGTVFQLRHPGGKRTGWTERVIYAFTGQADGSSPFGGVTLDKRGNLYGTTRFGGQTGGGTVFELSPTGGGKWTETVLHSFDYHTEGYVPEARLILDKAGNIFGTTLFADAFELSPPGHEGGSWTETILYNFPNDDPSSLVLSKWGTAVYGTTAGTGYKRGFYGLAFKIFLH